MAGGLLLESEAVAMRSEGNPERLNHYLEPERLRTSVASPITVKHDDIALTMQFIDFDPYQGYNPIRYTLKQDGSAAMEYTGSGCIGNSVLGDETIDDCYTGEIRVDGRAFEAVRLGVELADVYELCDLVGTTRYRDDFYNDQKEARAQLVVELLEEFLIVLCRKVLPSTSRIVAMTFRAEHGDICLESEGHLVRILHVEESRIYYYTVLDPIVEEHDDDGSGDGWKTTIDLKRAAGNSQHAPGQGFGLSTIGYPNYPIGKHGVFTWSDGKLKRPWE